MEQVTTKTVIRKITPTAKLVIDLPGIGAIEISSARTAPLAIVMPLDLAWREEPKAASSK
jgi:hypothetical protein